jgi:hypothetical protein
MTMKPLDAVTQALVDSLWVEGQIDGLSRLIITRSTEKPDDHIGACIRWAHTEQRRQRAHQYELLRLSRVVA